MTPRRNFATMALLGVPTIAYGAVMQLRNRFYDRPRAVRRAGIPVVSVGNLTMGGTGKTPIVAWLARALRAEGCEPAVVSRGYGGTAGSGPLFVSRGDGPLVGPDRCGDEPFLLARQLPGVLVVVGSHRLEGARAAHAAGAGVVILDDGFQHRRIARDFDLLLLDATNPFGNYRILPAGILREPLSSIARADAVLITRSRPHESLVVIERVVRRYHSSAPILRAGHRRGGFVDREGRPAPAPRRVVAFCGIGNPIPFATDLELEGIDVVHLRTFPDHHRYSAPEISDLAALAIREGAELVTTEKDLVRVPAISSDPSGVLLSALRIDAVVHEPDPLLDLVRDALRKARG